MDSNGVATARQETSRTPDSEIRRDYGKQQLDIPQFILWISNILPITRDPIVQLLAQDAPILVSLDIKSIIGSRKSSADLWRLEPGYLATFELLSTNPATGSPQVVQHVGMVINKRISQRGPKHTPVSYTHLTLPTNREV